MKQISANSFKLNKSTSGKTPAFFHNEKIFVVGNGMLDFLKNAMRQDKSDRARLCLHRSRQDRVQEMIIAISKNTYIRPHKHPTRTESFQVIEGRIQMTFFNDRGEIIKKVKMAQAGNNLPFVCRVSPNIWHMTLPISEYAIFYEVLEGPFTDSTSKQAPWAPKETQPRKIKAFLNSLVKN